MIKHDMREVSHGNGLRGWVGSGFWAVLDQGLFAVSNFALNILLARWLGPAEYGVFALAFSIFLLVGMFHTALVTEPMLVFGAGRYRGRLGPYLASVFRGHWIVGGIAAVLLAVAGGSAALAFGGTLGGTLVACGAACPFLLFQWVARRACYVDRRPRLAATAGALYLVLVVGGALGLRALDLLGSAAALGLMAAASVISATWLLRRLAPHDDAWGEGGRAQFQQVAFVEHWRYGRWALAAAALAWVAGEAYYVILTLFHGYEATGLLRAGVNLVMPALQSLAALATVALPALVTARLRGTLRQAVLVALAAVVAIAGGYALVLNVVSEVLVDLVYAAAYSDLVPTVRLLSLVPIAAGIAMVLGSALRALETPRAVFTGQAVGAGVAALFGVAAIRAWDVGGAALSMLVVSTATAIALAIVLWQAAARRREQADGAPDGGSGVGDTG